MALVGAYGDDIYGELSGSAYIFSATSGAQIAKLVPADGYQYEQFGFAVDISGTTAIVGAPRHQMPKIIPSGSAYLYSIIPEPTTLYLATLAIANLLLSRRH